MIPTIQIDLEELKKQQLNETYAAQFANQIKFLLRYLTAAPQFGGGGAYAQYRPSVSIRGNKNDLESFKKVLGREKRYMDSYLKHGLADPKVLNNKYALDRAIASFERDTGLKWPLK